MYKTARVKFWTNVILEEKNFICKREQKIIFSDLQSDNHRKKVNRGLKVKNLISPNNFSNLKLSKAQQQQRNKITIVREVHNKIARLVRNEQKDIDKTK
jgi:hypothetical protein